MTVRDMMFEWKIWGKEWYILIFSLYVYFKSMENETVSGLGICLCSMCIPIQTQNSGHLLEGMEHNGF